MPTPGYILTPADFGHRMATEIFSPNGVLDHGSYKFVGTEGGHLFHTRSRALLTSSRNKPKAGRQTIKQQHRITRVYSQTAEGDDFVVIGELNVEFDNGKPC